ncbi:spore coat protein CotJB [Bacillaceae bacterium Marseille-Q3522]|nr:spore coat protein CotJB [Bacillaceae bacterium Marseille-Q3522]
MANTMPKEYYQQLEEIQTVDFVIDELVLYLDTHPYDRQAIQQYNQFAHYSRQLKQHFETQYGLFQKGGINNRDDYWTWSGPWPWQI